MHYCGAPDAGGSQVQPLDTYWGPLPSLPPWYAGSGNSHQEEEETSGAATRNSTKRMAGLICMRVAWTCVSSARTARSCCIARCQPVQRGCSRPWRPIVRSWSSVSHAFAPGMGSLTSARAGIPCGLGHALSRKALHGGQAKHATIDAQKIAGLLRGGLLPQAAVSPAARRATRDLLRRRPHGRRTRAEWLTHIQPTHSQYTLPELGKKSAYTASRDGLAERLPAPAGQQRRRPRAAWPRRPAAPRRGALQPHHGPAASGPDAVPAAYGPRHWREPALGAALRKPGPRLLAKRP